eukprot:TRINITY_DN67251_c0_g1_i1.p1 TRINITY_DN67251_c0_g1~~TRINITY_DN67251_c0_g1_i1.p1  ORF type:complete len:244 (+),score=46.36 TRINITY_DN67251_c0_g1_i1:89-820(+)
MYGLRSINNLYEAGSRSDFVIVGHPEFSRGRQTADKGYGPGWDTSQIPTYPKTGIAIARLARSGGSAPLLKRITVELGTKPKPQERVLARKNQQVEEESLGKKSLSASKISLRSNFDAFVAALKEVVGDGSDADAQRRRRMDDGLPPIAAETRLVTGSGNHAGEASFVRHRQELHGGLYDIALRLKRNPEKTERDLLATDEWRFWAQELEVVMRNRRHENSRKDHCLKAFSESISRRAHKPSH